MSLTGGSFLSSVGTYMKENPAVVTAGIGATSSMVNSMLSKGGYDGSGIKGFQVSDLIGTVKTEVATDKSTNTMVYIVGGLLFVGMVILAFGKKLFK
jgi:hypothetical protein